ncbi:hypothetical protein CIK97_05830 [Prevotella sp. P3-120]|uniref:hypothetical protein n=1 Tax=unclassified Prevotella TaxID=2638335 RepID=UPI000B95F35A|nr:MULTISPECIES: hypothetical protein [unclassified Prevotella]OYP50533.1 hypothetical protein CIK97_05830 [Prevotella sp. P3-120]OYP51121.1 hypothetical protein CIK93_06165 [Prevotella sp. P3-92]
MIRQEIIKQYVASLKEDGELDFIFPILLERMGFRILSTPKQSKGQSQYGRDVIAVKKLKGVPTLYLFELKGFVAKDITDRNLNAKDGLIESLRASKYTEYEDAGIPGLKDYPRQYVFAHNGFAEANVMPTLNGFIKTEFPEGNFERWDLERLTALFSDYLFDETLLADDKSYKLFKKVLVLQDAEENDFSDLVALVDYQIEKLEKEKHDNRRVVLNYFGTLRLIGAMMYYYARESNNLYPAKFCIDTIVLKTWAWILRGKREKKSSILSLFYGLVMLQMQIYEEYINKILQFANLRKGLYSFQSSLTEQVFYPLRCYEFLSDLIYFYVMTEACGADYEKVGQIRMDALKAIIRNNSACTVPLLDTHTIPILMVFRYMIFRIKSQDDADCLGQFVMDTVLNLIQRYRNQKMWPELSGNRMALAKSLITKSDEYCCDSSLLLTVMFELISYLNIPEFYTLLKKAVEESEVDLQVAYPEISEYDIEQSLFEHRLHKEISVETSIKLPETLDEFKQKFRKKYKSIKYRTDSKGYGFLRLLAHKYYETDLFPDYLGREYCTE